jgi:hypothetical protein
MSGRGLLFEQWLAREHFQSFRVLRPRLRKVKLSAEAGEKMPGHNHYSSCTCGWCVNFGRRYGSFTVLHGIDAGRASTILREFGADRSRAACFVDHNARCPVCNERVFYYQNAHGSRVFFDELGPPWTKHPCTDNGRPTAGTRGLSLRSRGVVAEIRSSFEALGRPLVLDWRLGVVASRAARGGRTTITVLFFGEAVPTSIGFVGDVLGMEPGDAIAVKGKRLSYFDRTLSEQRILSTGESVVDVSPQPPGQDVALTPPEVRDLAAGGWENFVACWRRPPRGAEMRPEEEPNFHGSGVDVATFTLAMEEEVRKAWQAGRRSLRAMAELFNVRGLTTACGLSWTPRRLYILLKLIHWKPETATPRQPSARTDDYRATGKHGMRFRDATQDQHSTKGLEPSAPRALPSRAALAAKFAAFGRVTFKGKPPRS